MVIKNNYEYREAVVNLKLIAFVYFITIIPVTVFILYGLLKGMFFTGAYLYVIAILVVVHAVILAGATRMQLSVNKWRKEQMKKAEIEISTKILSGEGFFDD